MTYDIYKRFPLSSIRTLLSGEDTVKYNGARLTVYDRQTRDDVTVSMKFTLKVFLEPDKLKYYEYQRYHEGDIHSNKQTFISLPEIDFHTGKQVIYGRR